MGAAALARQECGMEPAPYMCVCGFVWSMCYKLSLVLFKGASVYNLG